MAQTSAPSTWRSALYPVDWTPCYAGPQGMFIQDFSFAGYHAGMKPLPGPVEPVVDVTQPPYNADNTGQVDATEAIQAAIDAVGASGGGTVYLPAGTYLLSVTPERRAALIIRHSGVQLRGDGPGATFLRLETHQMQNKDVIRVQGDGDWTRPTSREQRIAVDLTYPTQVIPLEGTPQFEVGDWVILTHDTTAQWVWEHNMGDLWPPGQIPGATFYRQVIAVDREKNEIVIDAPIRYYLMRRDNARVYRVGPHVEEVGLADFSIGMVEHPGEGWGGTDYQRPGTAAYDVHGSHVIRFMHAVNSWVQNVHTYKPEPNRQAHILSNGILVWRSRFITIQGADFRNPQYLGEGGNGYHYTLMGNDSLIIESAAYNGRHNYDFKQAYASGNVITRSYAYAPQGLRSDFHMHLSPSNLIDAMVMDQDRFDAGWRGTSGTLPHGLTTTQTVLWNTRGEAYHPRLNAVVYSEQYGWGYVIGTQGPAFNVSTPANPRTLPADYQEGIGEGATLEPQSLYADQLARRRSRPDTIIHCPELDFRPHRPRIHVLQPQEGQTVRGDVAVEVKIEEVEGIAVDEVRLALDGTDVFQGARLPEDWRLDTTTLADGRHTLVVTARATDGTNVQQAVTFSVDNWWQLEDRMEPPLVSDWFGTLSLSRTIWESDGWTHATDRRELFFGDGGRRARAADTTESLVWDAPNLREFTVTLYTRDASIIQDVVALAVGPKFDGKTVDDEAVRAAAWTPIPYEVEVQESAGDWHKVLLAGTVPAGPAGHSFRVTLVEGHAEPDSVQLGAVSLRGLNE